MHNTRSFYIYIHRHTGLGLSNQPIWISILIFSFFIAVAGGVAWTKNTFGDLISLVLTVVGAAYMLLRLGVPVDSWSTPLIISGSIGIVLGIGIAIFAVKNFNEIVSYRWLYHNSNTSKFQESSLYGFSRFCIGFHIGVFAYALMLW